MQEKPAQGKTSSGMCFTLGRVGKQTFSFILFPNQKICCGYSKEQSQWNNSFEHPKHMLKLVDKKRFTILAYGKYSIISNTGCLPKRPIQTEQTQIRLLLQKQPDPGLPCSLFRQAFCKSQP